MCSLNKQTLSLLSLALEEDWRRTGGGGEGGGDLKVTGTLFKYNSSVLEHDTMMKEVERPE